MSDQASHDASRDAGTTASADLFDRLVATWRARRSQRAYHPEPLDRARIVRLFEAAQAAPSWCNVQPWRVVVTEPPATAALAAEVTAAARQGLERPDVPFPADYPAPHREHRAACAGALYRAIGISRHDRTARHDAWLRNFRFFDAPHIAIVSCDRRLGPYAYLDVGVWLGYLLTAAAALGIDTCPMASLASYPRPLRARLPIPDTNAILLGLALGRADTAAPVNACTTTREPVTANVAFTT
jgi:nitroreductase